MALIKKRDMNLKEFKKPCQEVSLATAVIHELQDSPDNHEHCTISGLILNKITLLVCWTLDKLVSITD